MSKTAILVDGGFYRRKFEKGVQHTPEEAADALITYCYRHLKERYTDHELYRIFYYDCRPCGKKIFHPRSSFLGESPTQANLGPE